MVTQHDLDQPAARIGSLFTGYGGLDAAALALLGPDAHIVWHSDIKPAACTLLDHRDPDVPNLGDIKQIDPDQVEPVDALTFGWPCQPHSAAGKRLGEKDPRALWPEVARLIAGLRPRYLFGENVARVTSNGELARVTRALADLGYVGTYRTRRASDTGAPHRRDRLALFAVRGDIAADTIRAELRHEPGRRGGPGGTGAGVAGDDGPERTPGLTLLPTPAARLGSSGSVTRECAEARAARRPNGPNLDDAIALLPTPRASDGPNGGPNQRGRRGDLAMPSVAVQMDGRDWGKYTAAVHHWEALTRPAPDPTAPLGSGGAMRLAPAFVEWMMGLPAGWVTDVPGLTRAQQLSMLGDGVVPQWAVSTFAELAGRFTWNTAGAA